MKFEFASAMRRATELVGAGDPEGATKIIQAALGRSEQSSTKTPKVSSADQEPYGVHHGRKRRSLRETLADLAANLPSNKAGRLAAKEPTSPEGARFDRGTFTCFAGVRDYRVYIPNMKGATPAGIVMMLHGCTQTPVDFANGTGMNLLGDQHGLIVVYPAQSRRANTQSCWNWFSPSDQDRDAGEPAILAMLAEKLRAEHHTPQDKVFVAGLSAGAAMALILGRTYPDIFAAVGAHSGLPYKCAHDVPSAFAAMSGAASAPKCPGGVKVPTIIFHGTADATVSPLNSQRIANEMHPEGTELLDQGTRGGRSFTRSTIIKESGTAAMEHWRIDGLGHAWSGGDCAGSYADPNGPDASKEMIRFFLDLPANGE